MLALLVPGVHMGGGDGAAPAATVIGGIDMRAGMAYRHRMRSRWYPITAPLAALLRTF